jgi:ribonuclease P protein component
VRGERYLTRNVQFQLVYDNGRSWAGREVVIKALPNGLDISRYGLAVGRRIGKAVARNKIKRRLREILKQTPLQSGWDIVLIARAPSVQADFKSLAKCVADLIDRAGLSVGEYEGVRPRAN